MSPINCAIFGVGRSGTTALYKLLQDILARQAGYGLESVYEPFLWDRATLDKNYGELTTEFDSINSLSVDGMYHHAKIPLFVNGDTPVDPVHRAFIEQLVSAEGGNNHLLFKAVRANGRFALFEHLDIKPIFIMRNPVDVINSALPIFSFYGDDYHPSDLERFLEQVRVIYPGLLDSLAFNSASCIQREALYWYCMNRFFLEQSAGDSKVLKICYEHYTANRPDYLAMICEFLGLQTDASDVGRSEKLVGPSVTQAHITETDYAELKPYLALYQDLVDAYFPAVSIDLARIEAKYAGRFRPKRNEDELLGKTAPYIKNSLKRELIKLKFPALQKV